MSSNKFGMIRKSVYSAMLVVLFASMYATRIAVRNKSKPFFGSSEIIFFANAVREAQGFERAEKAYAFCDFSKKKIAEGARIASRREMKDELGEPDFADNGNCGWEYVLVSNPDESYETILFVKWESPWMDRLARIYIGDKYQFCTTGTK